MICLMAFLTSIPAWGWFDISFTVMVLVGICGESEWAQKFFLPERLQDLMPPVKWRKRLEGISELFVVFGIAGEVVCLAFSLIEASDFNRKASENEKQVEILKSNNMVLSIELEKAKQPRIITAKQRKDFIFLTEDFPKLEIKVEFPLGRNETANYAHQIREMLREANFKQESNAGPMGTDPNWTRVSLRVAYGDTNWPSVIIYGFSTNKTLFSEVESEVTNGFRRPIISNDSVESIAGNFIFVFDQIGIKSEWHATTRDVKPGEIEFYVMDKP